MRFGRHLAIGAAGVLKASRQRALHRVILSSFWYVGVVPRIVSTRFFRGGTPFLLHPLFFRDSSTRPVFRGRWDFTAGFVIDFVRERYRRGSHAVVSNCHVCVASGLRTRDFRVICRSPTEGVFAANGQRVLRGVNNSFLLFQLLGEASARRWPRFYYIGQHLIEGSWVVWPVDRNPFGYVEEWVCFFLRVEDFLLYGRVRKGSSW